MRTVTSNWRALATATIGGNAAPEDVEYLTRVKDDRARELERLRAENADLRRKRMAKAGLRSRAEGGAIVNTVVAGAGGIT